jgi:hypothetical protein
MNSADFLNDFIQVMAKAKADDLNAKFAYFAIRQFQETDFRELGFNPDQLEILENLQTLILMFDTAEDSELKKLLIPAINHLASNPDILSVLNQQ